MKAFWDERYDTEQYVYGKDPNEFFSLEIDKLVPGKILLPGEGEGRNAVYAASRGWTVAAFDQSRVGSQKAHRLAKEMGVQLDYQISGIESYHFRQDHYDVVGLTFVHVPPLFRKKLHEQVLHALKPGGVVILEAFHTSQLGNDTGGPQSLEMLFDKATILDDFNGLDTLFMDELTTSLQEGLFHKGNANIIRYLGEKHI